MADENESPKVRFGWGGLGDALRRAGTRSMSAGFFKNNVYLSQFRSGVVGPAREGVEIAKKTRSVLRDYSKAYEEQGKEVRFDVDAETMSRYVRNATLGWCIFAVLVVGGIAMITSTVATGSLLFAFNRAICGLAIGSYGLVMMLRCARDVAVMQSRRPLTLREFFSDFERYWCPWPKRHIVRVATLYCVIPLTVGIFVVLPFFQAITSAL